MRMLIWALLIYIGYKVVVALFSKKRPEPVEQGHGGAETATTHQDPVCGMYVSEEDAVVGRLDGKRYYFCSLACLEKYRDQLDHTP